MCSSDLALRVVQTLTRRALDGDGDLGRLTDARRQIQRLVEAEVERDTAWRRTWIGIDWVLTNLHGMIRDGVIERGFDAINDWDYQDWLRRHGASEMTVTSARSPGRCRRAWATWCSPRSTGCCAPGA